MAVALRGAGTAQGVKVPKTSGILSVLCRVYMCTGERLVPHSRKAKRDESINNFDKDLLGDCPRGCGRE